ncbi:hypothetical protein Ahy_A03g016178 isoform C [Arachis hypogaea]|uniref:Uncharacterized protein n=1 Tax=Arachis hypogaea TaxID=3818 RepID=A0A445E2N9_ARAHY|nr:hypothetical protein Ahy_A03g016178 isoform C [Arachis hypogaea]
MKANTSLHQ